MELQEQRQQVVSTLEQKSVLKQKVYDNTEAAFIKIKGLFSIDGNLILGLLTILSYFDLVVVRLDLICRSKERNWTCTCHCK